MKLRLFLVIGLAFSLSSLNYTMAAEDKKDEKKEVNAKLLDEEEDDIDSDEEEESEEKKGSKKKKGSDEGDVAQGGQYIPQQRANEQFRSLQRTGTYEPEQGPIRDDQYYYQDQYRRGRGRNE